MKRKARTGKSPSAGKRAAPVICWAVDPFNDDPRFHERALRVLRPFADALNAKVIPVCYIDIYRAAEKSGYYFPLLPLFGDPYQGLAEAAKERLKVIVSKPSHSFVGSPALLTHNGRSAPSLRDKVAAISKEAKLRGALFLALHTHSRSGLKRLLMGSFAETCMLYSDVPTLLIRPQISVPTNLNHILFPTDFSRESTAAFEKVLVLAGQTKARVTIVHYFSVLTPPEFLKPATIKRLNKESSHTELLTQKKGMLLALRGKKRGVRTNFQLIRDRDKFDPTDALIRLATRKRSGLIALAAQSGPVETKLIGAMSRDLVRHSPYPVLVYRT